MAVGTVKAGTYVAEGTKNVATGAYEGTKHAVGSVAEGTKHAASSVAEGAKNVVAAGAEKTGQAWEGSIMLIGSTDSIISFKFGCFGDFCRLFFFFYGQMTMNFRTILNILISKNQNCSIFCFNAGKFAE